MKKMRVRNLIYPTVNADVFIHIYPDTKSERDYYIPIEPVLTVSLNGTVAKVEIKLLEFAEDIGKVPEEEREEAFIHHPRQNLHHDAQVHIHNGKIALTTAN